MTEAAVPQARLTWHAAPPTASTTAPITLQAFALWPSFTPKPHHHESAPPPDYTLDVHGAFELIAVGGIQVAGVAVKIERGTKVARGFGAGPKGTDGGSLWWAGAHARLQGFWMLWLMGADEADLIAVHRILLFLPPLPQQYNIAPQYDMTLARPRALPTTRTLGPTSPIACLQSSLASIEGPNRNSLLLVDEDTNEVIAILPLDSLKSPPTTQAAFGEPDKALPPLPPTSSKPGFPHQHSLSLEGELSINPARGQALADRVNEIVAHLSPGRKHKHGHRGDEVAQTAPRERDVEDDGNGNRVKRSEGKLKDVVCEGKGGILLNLAASPEALSQGTPTRLTRSGSVAESEEEQMGRNTFDKLQHGFELLDAQMGTLDCYTSLPFVPIPQPTAHNKDMYESPPFAPVPAPSPPIRDPYESPPFMPEASPAPIASDPYASPPLVPTLLTSRPLTFVDPLFSIPPTPTSIPLVTVLAADQPSFEDPQASLLRPGREGSITSVSTLATLGTERRFATAIEGHEREESRRTSSATFTTAKEGGEEVETGVVGGQNGQDSPADLSNLPPQSHAQPRHAPSLSILSSAPSHALTPSNDNTNSVLLRFLVSRSTITARLVSEDDIAREGLVPATVDTDLSDKEGEGWGWWSVFSGWKVKKENSWGSWLKGWWSAAASADASTPDDTDQVHTPHPSATINAPSSYASNFFIPSFSNSSLASTPRPVPRSRPRRANGEATSRLSIIFYDDEGCGRAAYVDGAGGGFGARGPVGGIGGGY